MAKTPVTAHNMPHPSGVNRAKRRAAIKVERRVTRGEKRLQHEGRRTAGLGEFRARTLKWLETLREEWALRPPEETEGVEPPGYTEAKLSVHMESIRRRAALEPIPALLRRANRIRAERGDQ